MCLLCFFVAKNMKILFDYLRQYRLLVGAILVLAAINQIFSLLDPVIFRHVIDDYATRYTEYTTSQFFRGVGLLLAAAVGTAFVSRVAKNFQDYYINVITQRLGAQTGRIVGDHVAQVVGRVEHQVAGPRLTLHRL